jgi:hypothetical protein
MKHDKRNAIVVVSRVGFDMLIKDGLLIEPLRDQHLIFVNSIRTSPLPPQGAYAELHLIELRQCNEYLTDLIRTLMTRHRVTQVLTISEQDLTLVVSARNALGFPGLDTATATLFRDKIAMKTALRNSGIDLPAYCEGADDMSVRDLFLQHKKLVAKPRDGYGSQDTAVLKSSLDVDNFLATPSQQRSGYLVEAFVKGDVYHLDAVVRHGEILFSSLGKYEVPPLDFIGRRWAGTRFSNANTSLHEEAKRQLLVVLQAFRSCDGVFHFEFFHDDHCLTFGEIAIRPVGGGVADAIYDTFGVHLMEEHVRVQLGMPTAIGEPLNATRYGASLLLLSEAAGVVAGYKGLEGTERQTLRRINYHYTKGDMVAPTRYSADSLLTCSLASSDPQHLDFDIQAIWETAGVVLKSNATAENFTRGCV